MVTSILTTPTYTDEHNVFVGNSKVSIEQPLICVDGYILACRFDGESCNPTFGISMKDLLQAVGTELMSSQLENASTFAPTSPPKSPLINSSMRKSITAMPHSLTYSRRRLFRQNSREGSSKKRDSEDLTGVTYDHIEHSPKDSFILPISNQLSARKSEDAIVANGLIADMNENMISKADSKKQLEIEWVKKHCSDYINTETVTSCGELQALMNILTKMTTAVLVTLKIVNSKEITVTYQFMEQFKRNYMFVKISSGYAMLMKAF